MPGITEDTVLVKQTQETDNGIIPTASGDDRPLTGETQLHGARERGTGMNATRTCNIDTSLKTFK